MRRRNFIAACFGVALWSGEPALAQHAPGGTRIGILVWGSPEQDIYLTPFREALRSLGYVEGENIGLEVRYARSSSDQAAAFATELVRANVQLIVASTTPAAHAAKTATSTIPIVMAPVADALATALVTNLTHPGGNITGVSNLAPDLGGKRLEVLREMIPSLRRVAFIGSSRDPNARTFLRETESAASGIGMQVQAILLDGPEQLDAAFERLVQDGSEALVIQPILVPHREKIARLALHHRLPSVSSIPAFAEAGILISYGANISQTMRQAATYVDKILKGQKPGELPVQHALHFELIINLQTARALGLEIPPALLSRVDEVIE